MYGVTGDGCLMFPAKLLLYSLLNMLLLNGKLFFRSQKDLKLIYLLFLNSITIIAGYTF